MPDHVLDALPGELLGYRQVTGLGHPGCTFGASVLQDQNIAGFDVEIGIVDARGEIVERRENNRPALMLEQARRRRGALEQCSAWRERPVQCDLAALRIDRNVDRANETGVDLVEEGLGEAFRESLPADITGIEI